MSAAVTRTTGEPWTSWRGGGLSIVSRGKGVTRQPRGARWGGYPRDAHARDGSAVGWRETPVKNVLLLCTHAPATVQKAQYH